MFYAPYTRYGHADGTTIHVITVCVNLGQVQLDCMVGNDSLHETTYIPTLKITCSHGTKKSWLSSTKKYQMSEGLRILRSTVSSKSNSGIVCNTMIVPFQYIPRQTLHAIAVVHSIQITC